MVLGVKIATVALCTVGMLSLFPGIVAHFITTSPGSNSILHEKKTETGAVGGRVVSVPAQVYREAFKTTLKLGQCPLVMEEGTIKTCKDEFVGDQVFLAKGSMTVDVTKVQSSEDILLHIMGGVGASVGVLGLASVSAKVTVAVTTETKKENLNLMSSYEMSKGVISLHNAKPKTTVRENGSLYLSEIELGGNEMLLVTLEFENEKQKTDVEVSVKFKILFWSITAKVKYVHSTFKSKAKVRIRFLSSWRKNLDITYSDMGAAIPKLEEVEAMYMNGPKEFDNLSEDNELTHNFYYFSSWKQGPYGSNINLALVNHDLEFLTEQNTEMLSTIHRLKELFKKSWSPEERRQLVKLNGTLALKTDQLTAGLNTYHTLSMDERQNLRDIYGVDNAPLFYTRELNGIVDK